MTVSQLALQQLDGPQAVMIRSMCHGKIALVAL
jgi:hypothetical protein